MKRIKWKIREDHRVIGSCGTLRFEVCITMRGCHVEVLLGNWPVKCAGFNTETLAAAKRECRKLAKELIEHEKANRYEPPACEDEDDLSRAEEKMVADYRAGRPITGIVTEEKP